jgi:hypothetical protein
MMVMNMNLIFLKVIEDRLVYVLKVVVCQRILDPKRLKTLEGIKRSEGLCEATMEVYIVRSMKAISKNIKLELKGYLNIIHFTRKIYMLNIL